MRVCHCILAGTKACDNCYNNGSFTYNGNYNFNETTTKTVKTPLIDGFTKEDYKEIIKYLIDKMEK